MPEKFDAATQDVAPRDAQKGGQGALSEAHPEIPLKEDAPVGPSARSESVTQSGELSKGLTSAQIELLCEIEERDHSKQTDEEKRDLERLLSEGYIIPNERSLGSRFSLTDKGMAFLGGRGAGLNEA